MADGAAKANAEYDELPNREYERDSEPIGNAAMGKWRNLGGEGGRKGGKGRRGDAPSKHARGDKLEEPLWEVRRNAPARSS